LTAAADEIVQDLFMAKFKSTTSMLVTAIVIGAIIGIFSARSPYIEGCAGFMLRQSMAVQ
jgi:hypothetical protein